MTDRQLSLLVRAWANRLSRELDLVADGLPETMPRATGKRYVGPSGLLGLIAPELSAKPENWTDDPGGYLVLDGLAELAGELHQAADTLVEEPRRATDES